MIQIKIYLRQIQLSNVTNCTSTEKQLIDLGKLKYFLSSKMIPRMPLTEIKDLCLNERIFNAIEKDLKNVAMLDVSELKSIITRYNEYFRWQVGDVGLYQNPQRDRASLVEQVNSILELPKNSSFLAWNSNRKKDHFSNILEKKKYEIMECPFCGFEHTREYLVTIHIFDCSKQFSNLILSTNPSNTSIPPTTQSATNPPLKKTDFRPSVSTRSIINQKKIFKIVLAGDGGVGKSVSLQSSKIKQPN